MIFNEHVARYNILQRHAITIRYEDLTSRESKELLMNITQFLGVDWRPELEDRIKSKMFVKHAVLPKVVLEENLPSIHIFEKVVDGTASCLRFMSKYGYRDDMFDEY